MARAATRARSLAHGECSVYSKLVGVHLHQHLSLSLSLSLSFSLSLSVRPLTSSLITEQECSSSDGGGGSSTRGVRTKQCMTATTAATPTRSRRRSCPASAVTPTELFSSTSVLNVANQPSGWGRRGLAAAGQIESAESDGSIL